MNEILPVLIWPLGTVIFFIGCLIAIWAGKLDPISNDEHGGFVLFGSIFWFFVPIAYFGVKFYAFINWLIKTIKIKGEEYRKNKIVDEPVIQPSTYRKPS